MTYRGQTFEIPRNRGGFVGNPNATNLPAEALVECRNIELGNGDIRGRKGSTHISLSNSGTGFGITDFISIAGLNQSQITVSTAGAIERFVGDNWIATLKTGWTVLNLPDFESAFDTLYINGGNSIPQTWDGSAGTTSDLPNPAVDWTANSSYPKQMVKHGRLNSMRLWAIGAAATPFTVYYSDLFNDDFESGGQFLIHTGDGTGIIAIAEFGDRLFCFSENDIFVIDDSSLVEANWGYFQSQAQGGIGNHKLAIRTSNDLIVMRPDGDIYSMWAVQQYGDYKAASLTRQSFMHRYIKDHVDTSQIAKFHALYHPTERAIYFWIVRSGEAEIDTALVFYEGREPSEAWSIIDGRENNLSGINAPSSTLVKNTVGDYRIYTYAYDGGVWRLGDAAINDNSNGYERSYKTPKMDFGLPRTEKGFKRIKFLGRNFGNHDLTLDWWVDNVQQTQKTFNFYSGGFLLNDPSLGLLNTSVLSDGEAFVEASVELNAIGKTLQYKPSNSNANENWIISKELIDFKPLGVTP